MRDRTFKPTLPRSFRKHRVTQDEIDRIRAEAKAAMALLTDPEFESVRTYLEQAKEDILHMHAKQSIYDVEEEYKVGDTIRRLFMPAKKEYTMLAGEYRFIERFVSDLNVKIRLAKDMEEKIQKEELEVVDDREVR
jgi:hypothetical protein